MQDVREPRPRHRPARQGQRPARAAGGQGSPGLDRGRLRPRAVHHRRLRRRDQPRVHGRPSSAAATTAPGCSPASRASSRASPSGRNVTLQGVPRDAPQRAAPHVGSGGTLLLAIFVLFIVINAHRRPARGGGGGSAALGRRPERLEQRRRPVRRRLRRRLRRRRRRFRRRLRRLRRRPQRRRRRRGGVVRSQ